MAYFRFDINDATGDLDANRPVPFRLTPNISEFLTTIGVSGPLTASMIAVARCFAQPNFKVCIEDIMFIWERWFGTWKLWGSPFLCSIPKQSPASHRYLKVLLLLPFFSGRPQESGGNVYPLGGLLGWNKLASAVDAAVPMSANPGTGDGNDKFSIIWFLSNNITNRDLSWQLVSRGAAEDI